MDDKLDPKIQRAVDDYLELYIQFKEIEKKLKGLRDKIEPYMVDNNFQLIDGLSIPGCIYIDTHDKSYMNSRYTSYNLDDILPHLNAEAKRQCIVKVVDKDALEALCTLGVVPKKVLNLKHTYEFTKFSAKID